ncbi:shTK domain protein [Ancylostoma duodenale]|uniref:ShTK domain protein n=1 Tax=Ancylostoma duodenale TaxID=51022 RepID=A0A0C2F7D8_9BILA|nr:shTK domain protein [Ancylostoma duodenale]
MKIDATLDNAETISATPMPTTQPPIITTTPAAPTQETCFNEQQCCSVWAGRGECSRNPSYMNLWCKASCNICTPTTYNLNTDAPAGQVEVNAAIIRRGCPRTAGRRVTSVGRRGHRFVVERACYSNTRLENGKTVNITHVLKI